MVNELPRPGPSLCAVIDPPCISMSCLASASPMPSPACDRWTAASSCMKRSNTRGSISFVMPTPESVIMSVTSRSTPSTFSET